MYVPLDQPLAGLIVAALEPDSQSSYAANRLLDPAGDRLLRVTSELQVRRQRERQVLGRDPVAVYAFDRPVQAGRRDQQ